MAEVFAEIDQTVKHAGRLDGASTLSGGALAGTGNDQVTTTEVLALLQLNPPRAMLASSSPVLTPIPISVLIIHRLGLARLSTVIHHRYSLHVGLGSLAPGRQGGGRGLGLGLGLELNWDWLD